MMRRLLIFAVLLIACMDSGAATARSGKGWSVRICPQTEATRLGLQSGPSRHNNSVWGEWIKGASRDEIRFPKTHQSLGSIYFQANNYEGRQVELCVLFDGKVKRHLSFDGQSIWRIIETTDTDDCPC